MYCHPGKEDRYIMIGNHRDSWTYGAADPSSGTAAMMEIVRSLGSYKKETGWRPRRSIMACSWGAEEPGMLGSAEWADENHRFLTQNVVTYLNVDMAVDGNFTVRLKALDIVSESVFEAAKIIPAPDAPTKSLYEDWHIKSALLENTTTRNLKRPTYNTPAGSSDHKAMWHMYGTTIADFRYHFNRLDFPKLPRIGPYHSLYDSIDWMKKFVDPDYTHHLAIGRLMASYALLIADASIIPFDLVAYTKQVKIQLNIFESQYKLNLDAQNISLAFARNRLDALIKKTKVFSKWVKQIHEENKNALTIRAINDRIMNFERNFLIPGLLSNPLNRHVVYSSTLYKLHSTKFPGISEAIYFASKNATNDWDDVRKQITLVVWCFDTANRSLDMEESQQ